MKTSILHDYNTVIRGMIHSEGNFVNHRMTWFLTSQTILFAALTFAWSQGSILVWILSFVGFSICVSIFASLRLSMIAQRFAEELWLHRCGDAGVEPESLPPVVGFSILNVSKFLQAFLPWHFLPWLLGVTWIGISIVHTIVIVN